MFNAHIVVRLTSLICVVTLCFCISACNKRKAPEIDNKNMEHKLPASEKLGFKSEKRCELNEIVKDPEKGTPEQALLSLFEVWKKAADANWKGDEDAIFEEWRMLFNRGEQTNKTGTLKVALANTVQKAKLEHFVSEKEFAIIVCKKQKTGSDDSSYRFYVRNDKPKSSNKPITVLRDDGGKWKINDGSVLLY